MVATITDKEIIYAGSIRPPRVTLATTTTTTLRRVHCARGVSHEPVGYEYGKIGLQNPNAH